jgi:Tol biopolymer transport system component
MVAKTKYVGALAAAAGALVAVGLLLLMMLVGEVPPAGATFPGKNGKIAYVGGDLNIYTVNPGGRGKFRVTDNRTASAATIRPFFSPNGKRIAYTGYDGHDHEIYTINAGGGGRLKVTNNTAEDSGPSYSPNGKKIAYASYDGHYGKIYTNKVGGGAKFQVTDNRTDAFNGSWGSRP